MQIKLILISTIWALSSGVLNEDEKQCLRCICHVISGCHNLTNCATHGITIDHWRSAGNHGTKRNYDMCVKNDDCILEIIQNYTSRMGERDCNCDGRFNCDDRFAMYYDMCHNFKRVVHRLQNLYNSCSRHLLQIARPGCVPEDI